MALLLTCVFSPVAQGKPHYRRFRLTKDLCRLSWESANKDVTEASVLLSQITEMKLGQTTPIFKRWPVSGYEV